MLCFINLESKEINEIDNKIINYFGLQLNESGNTKNEIINCNTESLIDIIKKVKDVYDIILISSYNEIIDTDKSPINIKFFPKQDSVMGDLICINPVKIDKMIYSLISNDSYEAVNTLGYVKKIQSPIEYNQHLEEGGIFVKQSNCKLSNIYITFNSVKKIDKLLYKIQDFNILYSRFNCQFDNYISLGDHCAGAMSLNELNIRMWSFPFDWIITNFSLVVDYTNKLLESHCNLHDIVNNFIDNEKIEFPHDTGTKQDIKDKYIRRFERYIKSIKNGNKILFIYATRFDEVPIQTIQNFLNIMNRYNQHSKLLYISGVHRPDMEANLLSNIQYKCIPYDKSLFYRYDYTHFRPEITKTIKQYI